MDAFDDFIESVKNDGNLDDLLLSKGNNNNSNIVAYGHNFDSLEELDVYEWLLEAEQLGFVKNIIYQPPSFLLYGGCTNEKGKLLVRPHVYTADYKFETTDKWDKFRKDNKIKIFDKFDTKTIYIDVKGAWSKFSDGRDFQINSKWVLDKYNIFIWKIIPIKLFEKTWLPEKCMVTRKTKKISKKYKNFKIFKSKGFLE